MLIWGISALGHDAAISVVTKSGDILFASQSERFSRVKNDHLLNDFLISEARRYGDPNLIVWYEHPLKKRLRCLYSGQLKEALIPQNSPRRYLDSWDFLKRVPLKFVGHHASHAAAGFFTSGFSESIIIVVDAIGEMDTISLWWGGANGLKILERWTYPNSLGLLYSAFTQRIGLKPNEEEFILMGLAAYGKPIYVDDIRREFLDPKYLLTFRKNPHLGVQDFLPQATKEDLAASIQALLEDELTNLFEYAKMKYPSKNLVYMGGVALNCVANTRLVKECLFEQFWIMPNPGDAGSSLGAAAFHLNKQLDWRNPFLGYEIKGEYPVEDLLNELLTKGIVGVARGRGEFGPRALGARSLLADPRDPNMKDRVNLIKQRETYRPFAPVILHEYAQEWFEMVRPDDPYMQYVAKCRRPDRVPAVCHADGTSRVQTVRPEDHPGLHQLLKAWHSQTGCPILLNTSLNVKGEPLVNDSNQAHEFSIRYGVKVF